MHQALLWCLVWYLDAFDRREAALPSDACVPSFSPTLSSSLLVPSPRSLLLEAHPLRKIGPSQHPPPLVTRVRPSDLLLYL